MCCVAGPPQRHICTGEAVDTAAALGSVARLAHVEPLGFAYPSHDEVAFVARVPLPARSSERGVQRHGVDYILDCVVPGLTVVNEFGKPITSTRSVNTTWCAGTMTQLGRPFQGNPFVPWRSL